MSLRIGLISDVHAEPAPLREALTRLRATGVDAIYCAGDIAGYGTQLEETVALLIEHRCQAVLGNHDLWHLDRSDALARTFSDRYLGNLPLTIEAEVAGKRLCVTHASPSGSLLDGIRLLDAEGRRVPAQQHLWTELLADLAADVLVVGHTHQVFVERLGEVIVINPGSTLFNHTCAILTLPAGEATFLPLSGKEPVWSWNFSMFRGL